MSPPGMQKNKGLTDRLPKNSSKKLQGSPENSQEKLRIPRKSSEHQQNSFEIDQKSVTTADKQSIPTNSKQDHADKVQNKIRQILRVGPANQCKTPNDRAKTLLQRPNLPPRILLQPLLRSPRFPWSRVTWAQL